MNETWRLNNNNIKRGIVSLTPLSLACFLLWWHCKLYCTNEESVVDVLLYYCTTNLAGSVWCRSCLLQYKPSVSESVGLYCWLIIQQSGLFTPLVTAGKPVQTLPRSQDGGRRGGGYKKKKTRLSCKSSHKGTEFFKPYQGPSVGRGNKFTAPIMQIIKPF